ncbi:MAG TPA: hypothetical protein VNA14_12000 [Mycobacteriales bacterium]|nr:hypothetical protein [Mycobacteriales bacterium]
MPTDHEPTALPALSDRKALVARLMEAGSRAPVVLAEAAAEGLAANAARYAESVRGTDDVEVLVRRVISAHRTLARVHGASAGAAVSFAEITTVVGTAGTLTLPAAAVTLTGDIIGLAWIQTRMTLIVAALYGHDPRDPARVKELLTFNGVYGTAPVTTVANAASQAGRRVGKRLLVRYLRGETLQTLKLLFRLVGIRFGRAGLMRGLPLVNIPINAVVNERVTAALGRKAAGYYRTLPAPSRER